MRGHIGLLAVRAAQRAAKQHEKWAWAWAARLHGVGSHRSSLAPRSQQEVRPESPQISPGYCDKTGWLRTTVWFECHRACATCIRENAARHHLHQLLGFAPWAECPPCQECLPGATHSPCAGQPCPPCREWGRAGQGWVPAQRGFPSAQPSPGPGVSTSPADKPHRACQDAVPGPGLAAAVKSH